MTWNKRDLYNLVDGWLELESDPGLFSLLLEDMGVKGVQVEEIYDLQKESLVDNKTCYGAIFLFRWIEERRSRREMFDEEDLYVRDEETVNGIFFAQQMVPNSCATHALVSILLNCPELELGSTLTRLRNHVTGMNPENKGLAIGNCPELALAHNSHAVPRARRRFERNIIPTTGSRYTGEAFHFVSYVPINGRLFELDGLKRYPIDHGPIPEGESWTEKLRAVITQRLGIATGGGVPYHDIRFALMAVVRDTRYSHQRKLKMLKINREIVITALRQLLQLYHERKHGKPAKTIEEESKMAAGDAPAQEKVGEEESNDLEIVSNNGITTEAEQLEKDLLAAMQEDADLVSCVVRSARDKSAHSAEDSTASTSKESSNPVPSGSTENNQSPIPMEESAASGGTPSKSEHPISDNVAEDVKPDTEGGKSSSNGSSMQDESCILPPANDDEDDGLKADESVKLDSAMAVEDNQPADASSKVDVALEEDKTEDVTQMEVKEDEQVDPLDSTYLKPTNKPIVRLSRGSSLDSQPKSPFQSNPLLTAHDYAKSPLMEAVEDSSPPPSDSPQPTQDETSSKKEEDTTDSEEKPSDIAAATPTAEPDPPPADKADGDEQAVDPNEASSTPVVEGDVVKKESDDIDASNVKDEQQPTITEPDESASKITETASEDSAGDASSSGDQGDNLKSDLEAKCELEDNSGPGEEMANEGKEEEEAQSDFDPETVRLREPYSFSPQDLLQLLRKVETDIFTTEGKVRDEMEKHKKYRVDDCRRVHNYDEFITTFLTMLAEQNMLADLVEHGIGYKRPVTTPTPAAGRSGGGAAGAGDSASNARKSTSKSSGAKSRSKKKKKYEDSESDWSDGSRESPAPPPVPNNILYSDPSLPKGWSRRVKRRNMHAGVSAGRFDVFIVSPTGRAFKSRSELRNYLDKQNSDLDPEIFDFTLSGKKSAKAATGSASKGASASAKKKK